MKPRPFWMKNSIYKTYLFLKRRSQFERNDNLNNFDALSLRGGWVLITTGSVFFQI